MKVMTFSEERFGEIRAIAYDKFKWIVAKDVFTLFGPKYEKAFMKLVPSHDLEFVKIPDGDGKKLVTAVSDDGLEIIMGAFRTARQPGFTYQELKRWKMFVDDFTDWLRLEVFPIGKEPAGETTVSVPQCAEGNESRLADETYAIDMNEQEEEKMENKMQVFDDATFGSVRTIVEDGKVLFCGSDVAKALGYARPNDAITAHCKYTAKRRTPTSGGVKEMAYIMEGDLYRLIARSKLPEAEKFESWIFDEIVPTVRMHGIYATPKAMVELLKKPESLLVVLQELASEQGQRRALESQVEAMRPKEEYFDKLCDIGASTSIRKTAIQFSINERTFIQYLLDEKYLYRGKDGRLTPYKRHSESGLFTLKDCVNQYGYWVGAQTIITPKGKQKLMEELRNKKMLALAN